MVLLREVDNTHTIRNWVVALPHLIRYNNGLDLAVEFSSDFLECIANPQIFSSDSTLPAAAKERISRLEMPMSLQALESVLLSN